MLCESGTLSPNSISAGLNTIVNDNATALRESNNLPVALVLWVYLQASLESWTPVAEVTSRYADAWKSYQREWTIPVALQTEAEDPEAQSPVLVTDLLHSGQYQLVREGFVNSDLWNDIAK